MITASDIGSLFESQLAKIASPETRQLVVECWVEGCRQGNWQSVEDLKRMPFTLLTECHGVSFIEHTVAVTEGGDRTRAGEAGRVRRDALRHRHGPAHRGGGSCTTSGSSWRSSRAGTRGSARASTGSARGTRSAGPCWPPSSAPDDRLLNTIACHAKEGDGRPQCVETVLIHQADFATFKPAGDAERRQADRIKKTKERLPKATNIRGPGDLGSLGGSLRAEPSSLGLCPRPRQGGHAPLDPGITVASRPPPFFLPSQGGSHARGHQHRILRRVKLHALSCPSGSRTP